MDDWFLTLRSASTLPLDAVRALDEDGFVVLPGPVPAERFAPLVMAYDAAVASAPAADVRVGRASTRVNDFVSRGSAFDVLYSYPPLLEACCRIIGRPFKLSSLHARTLHAGVPADTLHVDVAWESEAWPLAAFILMVDAFRPDNGATRFVAGSHRRPHGPREASTARATGADTTDPEIPACGPPGSVLVFHGSAWHEHSANSSTAPRRSLQGAFIPRDGPAAMDWSARLAPERIRRLGPLERYLLALPS